MNTIKTVFLNFQSDGLNLTSFLAAEGQDEALEQVMGFGGTTKDAIYGYAYAGNTDKVSDLLAQCNEINKNSLTAFAIRGLARAGHFDSIHAIPDYRNHMNDIMFGMAQAGNKSKIGAFLDKKPQFFPQVIAGYADCNQGEHLKKLLPGTNYYPLAIYHAARSGHTKLVDELLRECGVNADYVSDSTTSISQINAYSLLNHAIKGYTAGRHFNDAVALLQRGASISECLSELHDDNDLPQIELYLALLATIDDPALTNKVLKKISLLNDASEKLNITPERMEQIQKIKLCMKELHVNYIEAKNKVEKNTSETTLENDITLFSLGEIIKTECSLKLEEFNIANRK